jgi:steroid 5-alpha reductase family enzyme
MEMTDELYGSVASPPYKKHPLCKLNMRQGGFQSWFRHPNLNIYTIYPIINLELAL